MPRFYSKTLRCIVFFVILSFCSYSLWRATISSAISNDTEFIYPGAKQGFSEQHLPILEQLGLTNAQITNVDDELIENKKTIFVSGFSDNHFQEGWRMLLNFHMVFPRETIQIYNLGFNEDVERKLKQTFDFVSILPFQFEKYPDCVRDLLQYRWKPLIIGELIHRYGRVVWMDTSIVITQPFQFLSNYSLLDREDKLPAASYGAQLFDNTTHSILATTNPLMYDFLPGDQKSLRSTFMFGADFFFLSGLKHIRQDVLKWWILCALEVNCMAPLNSKLLCSFSPDKLDFAECHRYDQSALNILLANANDYIASKYSSKDFIFVRL